MPIENVDPQPPLVEPLKVHGTKWEYNQLNGAVHWLLSAAAILSSTHVAELAEIMKIVRDGSAIPMTSCATEAHVRSKYPVFCDACATTVGHVSPQKMIFDAHDEEGKQTWVAAFFGVGFILNKVGRENTLQAAEALLDELNDEASVLAFQKLCDDAAIHTPNDGELPN